MQSILRGFLQRLRIKSPPVCVSSPGVLSFFLVIRNLSRAEPVINIGITKQLSEQYSANTIAFKIILFTIRSYCIIICI